MLNRRNFVKSALAGMAGVGAILYTPLSFAKKIGVRLGSLPGLKKIGGSVTVKLDGQQVILIRQSEKTVKALSSVCTHRACAVDYHHKSRKIVCPCHGTTFNLSGKVLTGPATLPLPAYKATISKDILIIDIK
jgi:Rieske Fe-S protein